MTLNEKHIGGFMGLGILVAVVLMMVYGADRLCGCSRG